jgi:hypothetical protein
MIPTKISTIYLIFFKKSELTGSDFFSTGRILSRDARNIHHPTVSKRSRHLPEWKTAPPSHVPAVRLIRQQRASPPCGSRIPHSSSLPPRPLLRSSPALHASLAPFPPTHSHPRKVYTFRSVPASVASRPL